MSKLMMVNGAAITKDQVVVSEWFQTNYDVNEKANVLACSLTRMNQIYVKVEWSNDGNVVHHMQDYILANYSYVATLPIIADYMRVTIKITNYPDSVSAWVTFK